MGDMDIGFRENMRKVRNRIKESSNSKQYVPLTFEGTMAQFGRNLQREELQAEIDKS